MRAGTLATLAVLAFLLAGAIAFAYFSLSAGRPMSAQVFAALTSIVVGIGLMGLMFYSHREGFDEPPRLLPPPK